MFNAIAQPFGWLLMRLYEIFENYGIAVILFALIVKVILMPFQMKSKRGTMKTTRLQPELKELEKKHGANKAKYNAEVAALYKEAGVNPASGCLWGLIPFPILIALYNAIRFPLKTMMGVPAAMLQEGGAIFEKLKDVDLSAFGGATNVEIAQTRYITEHFNEFADLSDKLRPLSYNFFGLDLGQTPQWKFLWTTNWSDSAVWVPGLILFLIPILSGVVAFLSSKVSAKASPPVPEGQGGSMKMMMYMMPLVSVYFAYMVPAALGVYWTASSFFALIQDIWLTKRYTKMLDAEDAVRLEAQRVRNEEIERKRLETERKKAEGGATAANPNTSKRKKQVSEKQEKIERSSEWEKRNAPPAEADPSREGTRRFARGRAYNPDRFGENGEPVSDAEQADEDYENEVEAPVDELIESADDNAVEPENDEYAEDEYEDEDEYESEQDGD